MHQKTAIKNQNFSDNGERLEWCSSRSFDQGTETIIEGFKRGVVMEKTLQGDDLDARNLERP